MNRFSSAHVLVVIDVPDAVTLCERIIEQFHADVVGRVLDTTATEDVQVRLAEVDGEDGVWIGREVGDAD